MPIWLILFVIIWTTLVTLVAIVLGAFLMYCKQEKVNPIAQLRNSTSGFFTTENTKKEEESPGFYD